MSAGCAGGEATGGAGGSAGLAGATAAGTGNRAAGGAVPGMVLATGPGATGAVWGTGAGAGAGAGLGLGGISGSADAVVPDRPSTPTTPTAKPSTATWQLRA